MAKTATKKPASTKTKTRAATAKKPTKVTVKRKTSTRAVKSQKVDYYPNRVPFLVAVVAASVLMLVSVITVTNSQ